MAKKKRGNQIPPTGFKEKGHLPLEANFKSTTDKRHLLFACF